jgi:hypothetical protein
MRRKHLQRDNVSQKKQGLNFKLVIWALYLFGLFQKHTKIRIEMLLSGEGTAAFSDKGKTFSETYRVADAYNMDS